MEPFAIRCTTCRARLKVRDPHALGQILPCPKCGSMVLVERPAAEDEIEQTAASGPGGMSAAAPAATPAWLGNESFEQIDQLLDPKPGPEPSSTSHSGRWKQLPRNEAGSEKAGEPIPPAEADPETASPSSADETGPNRVSVLTDEKAPPPVAVARRYALMAGGALCGTVLAVGVTATVLMQMPNRSAENLAAPIEKRAQTNTQAVDTADEDMQVEKPAKPAPDPSAENPSETPPEPADIESDAADPPPPDPSPPDPVEPPREVTDGEVAPTEPPPPEPSPTTTDPAGQTPDAQAAEPSALPAVQDDGLASFARWLSSASAQPGDAPAPRPPTAAVAPSENAATVLVQPSRPVPRPVDVEARLEDKVAAIEFKDTPLVDVLRTLSDLSTIPITLDPDALGRRMLSPRKPVSLLRTDVTVAELLEAVLKPLRLGFQVSDGHVWVTTRVASGGQPVTIEHDLTDLAEGQTQAAGELARWLTQLVAYGTWQVQGGAGSYRLEDTVLAIEQSDIAQYQILMFCEKLRVARGLPTRSRIPVDAIRLEPVTQRMAALQHSMTLRVWQEQNLNQIAAQIEREAGVTVLVDWQALHLAGWSPADRIRFFCQQQPLEAALHGLLDPMGLTFRVIDEATLEISSPEAVTARNDVEFYRLSSELQSAEAVQALSGQIVQRVGQTLFQPLGSGAMAYDLDSQTLIVSLPQPAQQQLRELLAPPTDGR